MKCIAIDAYGLSAKKIIEQIREEVKLRNIEKAIVLVQFIGISRAAFNTLDLRSLSALFEKAFHIEYLPQFYSDVEIPDSIRLVKSMQEDFKIFISEQEMNEQEQEELLKLGLEYLTEILPIFIKPDEIQSFEVFWKGAVFCNPHDTWVVFSENQKNCNFVFFKNAVETLRHKLIYHGASIKFIDKICSLRLNASFRYKTEVAEILEKLKQEVIVQQVAYHKGLRKYQK